MHDVDFNRNQGETGTGQKRTGGLLVVFVVILKPNSQNNRDKLVLILLCQFPNTTSPSSTSWRYQLHEQQSQRDCFSESKTGNKKFSLPLPSTRIENRIFSLRRYDSLKDERRKRSSLIFSVVSRRGILHHTEDTCPLTLCSDLSLTGIHENKLHQDF